MRRPTYFPVPTEPNIPGGYDPASLGGDDAGASLADLEGPSGV